MHAITVLQDSLRRCIPTLHEKRCRFCLRLSSVAYARGD